MLNSIRQDVRFAIRSWARTPAFAITAILTLAIAIGANTAVFTVVSGVLLRSLPFPRADRLVKITEIVPPSARGVGTRGPVYVRDFLEFRAAARTVQAVATYTVTSRNLVDGAEPERLSVAAAEPDLFPLLGVAPALGRVFRSGDSPAVAVASAPFYRSHPGALGRAVSLDGVPHLLIGVMPESFDAPEGAQADLWVPAPPLPVPTGRTEPRIDIAIARLRPDVSVAAAQQELAALPAVTTGGRLVRVERLHDVVTGSVRGPLLVLLGAVGMVLLIACVNIANLLIARTASRDGEIATRIALGADRHRLLAQFVTEGLLLSAAGAVPGLALAIAGTRALVKAAADVLPRAGEIALDWRVFSFALVLCAATGIVFGVAPALTAGRRSAARQTRGVSISARDGLIVVQVALAFILLAGAGLLVRTFIALEHADTGFRADNVLTAHAVIPGGPEALAIEERVSQVPGVRAAGFISMLPLQASGWSAGFTVKGRPEMYNTELRYITPGYFRAMQVPLLGGRELSPRDAAGQPIAIVVNRELARRYFAGQDPVGIETDRGRIVGVVGDVAPLRPGDPPIPMIYYSMAQNFAQIRGNGSTLVIAADGSIPAAALAPAVRTAMREIVPYQPVFRIATMSAVMDRALAAPRLYTWLLGLFAAAALLLAVIGLYGVISYLVAQRSREFGIRLALGARPAGVLSLVMRRASALVALGLVLGVIGASTITEVLRSALYGVTPQDPGTFVTGAVLLAAVALAAAAFPALRAAKVDPAQTLRAE
jgi:putative ABC transport system permease protein